MDRQLKLCFRVGLLFALKELFRDVAGADGLIDGCWSSSKEWQKRQSLFKALEVGDRPSWKDIPRYAQDRFARFYQDCRLPPDQYEVVREMFFDMADSREKKVEG